MDGASRCLEAKSMGWLLGGSGRPAGLEVKLDPKLGA